MHPKENIKSFRKADRNNPLRIMLSACLSGTLCGYDGTANGTYPQILKLLSAPKASITTFCPEEFSFGSPREMCDIHGGDGFDVLDGKAKVLSDSGLDWTAGMIEAGNKMLEKALLNNVELAIMMDVSAACGSTVIYDGNRFSEVKKYQKGAGVAAAILMRAGITVISQRDYALLEEVYLSVLDDHVRDSGKIDHHKTEWYINYFKN